MSHAAQPLRGFAILVVEDDPLIALDLATTLEDAGATVVGPCASVAKALSFLGETSARPAVEGAVLDFDLRGETSAPIAKLLKSRGIPFIFHTGLDPARNINLEEFGAPVVPKPSTRAALVAGIAGQLGV
jgi:DNA-binding response OmpR family regulator